jgi:DNA-binding XRE family transcriptional regulator
MVVHTVVPLLAPGPPRLYLPRGVIFTQERRLHFCSFFRYNKYNMSTANFPQRLREARKRAGLTQRQLAEQAGMSHHVSRLERGLSSPNLSTLLRLGKVLLLELLLREKPKTTKEATNGE